MQEIQIVSIPFSWPNSGLGLAWGPKPDSSPSPIEWQRSLARISLNTAGQVLGHRLPCGEKGFPIVLDYKRIEGMPGLTCSLAHTSGAGKFKAMAVGASLLTANFMAAGVGIDLEWNQRPMREGAYKKFRHARDHFSWGQANQLLWTWMVKEACFKAASNTWGDEMTLINQIQLLNPFQVEGLAQAYTSTDVYMGDLLYRLIKIDCAGHALNIALAKTSG